MKNNELISKLKKLGELQPDEKFLKENRDLLLAQISNSGTDRVSAFEKILITSENLARLFSRPVVAFAVFLFALFGVNFSSNLLQNSKPNETLYLARIISEQVKVNTTINQIEREKLAIRFALRHAEDIATILSDEEFNVEDNYDQVAKLNNSFINEVSKVENRLSRLNVSSPEKKETEVKVENLSNDASNNVELPGDMIIADSSKEEIGVSIFVDNNVSSSSPTSSELMSSSSQEIIKIEPGIKVNKAKELAEQGDISGALNKLNEAVELIKK